MASFSLKITGIKVGTTEIIVKAAAINASQVEQTINVEVVEPTILNVTPTDIILEVGKSQTISIETNAANYSFTVADNSIVSVERI